MSFIFKHLDSVRIFIIRLLVIKSLQQTLLVISLILISSCIKQFIPAISEDQDLLVVEGLITDQPGNNTIKISTSMPLGVKSTAKPLSGCNVTLADDLGNFYSLNESEAGTYIADPYFQGVVGRSYTLHIKTNSSHNNLTYQSLPVLMKPVPAIDSVYYEKLVLTRAGDGFPSGEGCQIYLNTHDPENSCKLFRWEYAETWEISLPYIVPNKICWVTNYSDKINIKNTLSISDDRIVRFPINFVSNTTDRLKLRYSILINQYSLNDDEYVYWEKLQNIVEQVGSLYDMIPSSTPGNISCIEKPAENVLGYFSVSAVKSKRIFIDDKFRGMPDLYTDCANTSVNYWEDIPGLDEWIWVIIDHPQPPPGYKILTFHKGCADCTTRGTTIRPYYWEDFK